MARKPKVRWVERVKAWRCDVGPVGKSGRRTPKYFREIPPTAKGERQAQEALEAYLKDRDREEALSAKTLGNPAVVQVVEAYLQHAERSAEPRTLATHAERLGTWMRRAPGAIPDEDGILFDPRPARSLKPADLGRVAKAMTEEGMSPHYVAGILASVKACWAWAARHEEDRDPQKLVPEDVFKDVKGPRVPAPPERYFPPTQAESLLRFIEGRAEATPGLTGEFERLTALLYRCLYESGARPSELCRATWRDFDSETGVIVLHKHKTGKKTGKPRRVPLTGELARRVGEAKSRPGAHPEFIFTHKRGRGAKGRGMTSPRAGEPWKVGPLGQKFRKLRVAAGRRGVDVRVRDGSGQVPEDSPECTLYDFRRTFSTDADDAGFTDERTAAAMGNSPEMVARIYKTRHAKAAVQVAEAVAAKRRKGQEQA